MKKLRVAMMAAALSVGMTALAHAQDAQPQGQRGGRGMQAMLQGITLTAAQQPKVDSLIKKFDADNQAMRAEMQNGGDRQALMGKMRETRAKQAEELKALLTDDQKKVFDKNMEDARNRMGGGGRPGGTPPTI
jgi:periplasmic protein CpxP/Spy